MEANIILMTPELASNILKANINNRRIRPAYVSHLKRSILNGEWVLTHQGVAISKSGILLDGQHRLTAIIEANKPVEILLCTNVDNNAFKAIDNGAKRNIGDLTKLDKRLAETAKFAIKMLHQNPSPEQVLKLANNQYFADSYSELMDFSSKNAKMFSSSTFKLAAIYEHLESGSDYPFKQYAALINSDVDALENLPKAYLKRAFNNQISYRNGTVGQLDLYIDARYLLDKKHSHRQRIVMGDTWRKDTFTSTRNLTEELLA